MVINGHEGPFPRPHHRAAVPSLCLLRPTEWRRFGEAGRNVWYGGGRSVVNVVRVMGE